MGQHSILLRVSITCNLWCMRVSWQLPPTRVIRIVNCDAQGGCGAGFWPVGWDGAMSCLCWVDRISFYWMTDIVMTERTTCPMYYELWRRMPGNVFRNGLLAVALFISSFYPRPIDITEGSQRPKPGCSSCLAMWLRNTVLICEIENHSAINGSHCMNDSANLCMFTRK